MLIKNIKTLVQVRDASHPKMLKGEAMKNLPTIDNAFLLIKNE